MSINTFRADLVAILAGVALVAGVAVGLGVAPILASPVPVCWVPEDAP